VHQLAYLPSPTQSVWHLGIIPVRAYALCIVAGMIIAVWLTAKRWRDRGGADNDVWDIAVWAIVFGLIGGRLYHVITDPELYFEHGENPINAFKVWDGGLGIWGAIALGGIGAWIGCRRKGIRLKAFADAAAPGIVFAQAIGRWGNWFNNELFGGPTSLPWRLQIHKIDVVTGHLTQCDVGAIGKVGVCGYYQPTFLYESLWDIALGVALIYIGRRYTLGQSNLFALYVMGYTVGRGWIEALREDHANHFLGVRLNDWTALLVFIAGAIWFYVHRDSPSDRLYTDRRRPPPDEVAADAPPADEAPADEAPADEALADEVSRDAARLVDADSNAEKVAPTE
jgi:prolipoprotein diacylglyceryl transferase